MYCRPTWGSKKFNHIHNGLNKRSTITIRQSQMMPVEAYYSQGTSTIKQRGAMNCEIDARRRRVSDIIWWLRSCWSMCTGVGHHTRSYHTWSFTIRDHFGQFLHVFCWTTIQWLHTFERDLCLFWSCVTIYRNNLSQYRTIYTQCRWGPRTEMGLPKRLLGHRATQRLQVRRTFNSSCLTEWWFLKLSWNLGLRTTPLPRRDKDKKNMHLV